MRNPLLLLPLLALCSCFNNYYSSRAINAPAGPEKECLQDKSKKMFIHFQDRTLLAVHPNWKNGILTASLSDPGAKPSDNAEGVHRFEIKDKAEIESHLHLFSSMSSLPTGPIISLPGRTITSARQHQYDVRLSIGGQVIGMAGVLAIAAFILVLVGLVMFTDVQKSFELDLNAITLT